MINIQDVLTRLTRARINAGLTQAQTAALLGFESASTISHWETDERGLELDNFLKLCECYGVAPEWVLTGINPAWDKERAQALVNGARNVAHGELQRAMDLLESLEWRLDKP